MAFRSDVSVNWAVSPRIITVASPSTIISLQDLVDTLRTLEEQLDNLDDPFLINAVGKDEIDAEGKLSKLGLLHHGPYVLCLEELLSL